MCLFWREGVYAYSLQGAYLLHPPPNLEQRTYANGAGIAALSPPAEDHQPHDYASCRPPRLGAGVPVATVARVFGVFPARRRSSEIAGRGPQ